MKFAKLFTGLLARFGWARLAGITLLTLLIALRVADPVFSQIARNLSFDYFQRLEPRAFTPQPVIIVDIDEQSIRDVGQWPWPRTQMATLVQNVAASGGVAIAFDMVFAEADRLSPNQIARDNPNLPEDMKAVLNALPENDDVFAKTIQQFRVVLGQTALRRPSALLDADAPVADVEVGFLGRDPKPHMLSFENLVQNRPEFEAATAGRGVFTVNPDIDGIIRRVPLTVLVEDKIRLSLAPELLRIATGGRAFAISTDEAGIKDIRLAGQVIRTDHQGHVWPYFSRSTPERFISATRVINATAPLPDLAGKLVLVGTSAIGLEDFRATPLGVSMPGVEIHAQVLENILSSTLLFRPHYAIAVELVAAATLSILLIIFLPKMGAALAVTGTSAILVGYVGLCWMLFSQDRLLVDPSFPALAGFSVFLVMAIMNYLREEQRRRDVHAAMGQYVSPALVDQLAQDPEKLSLGGENRELSILFSDVRDFTSISEAYKDDPQGLTSLMNLFLTEMSEAILTSNGTIDKFMGDAVMAFWNAPLDHEAHAHSACLASLDMHARVSALNATSLARDPAFQPIRIGIGINTGRCIVGNMGSDRRFDYTAIGDSVNLASRIEGLCKTYGMSVVLGHATASVTCDTFAIMEIDILRVKGKTQAEQVFALLGDEDLAQDPAFLALKALNTDMLSAFRAQEWTVARSILAQMEATDAQLNSADLSIYCAVYADRIAGFEITPPDADWDGTADALSK